MLKIFTGWLIVAFLVLMAAPAIALPLFSPASHPASYGLVAQTMAKKSLFSFSGNRPATLGVKDGQLASCPGSPNCVNSQSPASDAEHYIAPFSFSSSAPEAIARLKGIIDAMELTEVIQQTDSYLYAEFSTPLMGFVDDVEFFADASTGTVHVRSASRLGQSDLGVNRKRIEAIRTAFSA